MSTKSNTQEPPSDSSAKTQEQQQQPLPEKSEIPVIAEPKNAPKSAPVLTTAKNGRPPEPSANTDTDTAHVPSYSRWFSWDSIHECELRMFPDFFDSRSLSRNPSVYKYYRNSIIKYYRAESSRKITLTEVRKTIIGDVGSIRRVFDFLETWGLINYSPSALNKPLKWEDKDAKSGSAASQGSEAGAPPMEEVAKRVCNHCKSTCSIACFVCDKLNMTLCARCFVRGNYQISVNSSEFRRIDINEDSKGAWTDKDTLRLLEALMHFGDDWRKVAQHVSKSEKDCVSHFVKLPFGQEFTGYMDPGNVDSKFSSVKDHSDAECGTGSTGASSMTKRMRLTPLADASNPIMAQAAFLSALAGVKVAEAAAQAAVTVLSQMDYGSIRGSSGTHARNRQHEVDDTSIGNTNLNAEERAWIDANSQLEKEEQDIERAMSGITEVQMKEIQDKIVRFEELDLQTEKEWSQLEQMKNTLFADQLTLLFHKSSEPKNGLTERE